MPSASGSYGRLADRLADKILVDLILKKFFTGYTIQIFTSFSISIIAMLL